MMAPTNPDGRSWFLAMSWVKKNHPEIDTLYCEMNAFKKNPDGTYTIGLKFGKGDSTQSFTFKLCDVAVVTVAVVPDLVIELILAPAV